MPIAIRYAPNRLQRVNQRLPALAPVAWLFSYTFPPMDRLVLRLSGGKWTVTSWITGLPIVALTTTGAKSGQPRITPLIAIPADENVVLIASNWGKQHHPAWYSNLGVHPEVKLSYEGSTGDYVAHIAVGQEREDYWRQACAVYGAYPVYQQRTGGREIPVVVLTPRIA